MQETNILQPKLASHAGLRSRRKNVTAVLGFPQPIFSGAR